VKDIRLENESQVVQDVFPPLATIPPAMLGKAIRRSDRSRTLSVQGLLVGRLKHRALQAHQSIGAGDEFPPAFN
jgi:hypothetical protein